MGEDVTVQAQRAEAKASASVVRIGQRSYMSSWMLRSAKRSAAQALSIETQHAGDWASPHVEDHMDLVVTSVLTSANFLEAMVNELFTDAHEGQGLEGDGYLAPLDERVVRLMADWWEESGQGFDRTFAKYQLLLAFAGKDRLMKGAEPYQSMKLLLDVRNAIVHYKPKTVYSDVPHELEKKLTGRFETNNLMPSHVARPWPNGILSAGCAGWAHRSAEAFADEVSTRLGITPNYQRTRG